jgi:hypothetical protein
MSYARTWSKLLINPNALYRQTRFIFMALLLCFMERKKSGKEGRTARRVWQSCCGSWMGNHKRGANLGMPKRRSRPFD